MNQTTPTTYSWPVIIGAAIALSGAAVTVATFFGLRFGPADSFYSQKDLTAQYIPRKDLAASYLPLASLATDYIKKSEVDTHYLPVDQVNRLYVPKADYQRLEKQLADLNEKVSAIPTPFKTLTKTMTRAGVWTDERLGVSIKMEGYSIGSYAEVDFMLALPDAALHKETLDSRENSPVWTFMKKNREFTLSVANIVPTTFVIKEVGAPR